MDDPELRVDTGRGDAPRADALHDGSSALAFSADLHYRLVAVLGPESADRGMDGSEPDAAPGKKHFVRKLEYRLAGRWPGVLFVARLQV